LFFYIFLIFLHLFYNRLFSLKFIILFPSFFISNFFIHFTFISTIIYLITFFIIFLIDKRHPIPSTFVLYFHRFLLNPILPFRSIAIGLPELFSLDSPLYIPFESKLLRFFVLADDFLEVKHLAFQRFFECEFLGLHG
jgi:hypothetical protein